MTNWQDTPTDAYELAGIPRQEAKVAVMVLRPTQEIFTVSTEPKCQQCGWTDGCVDDEHGSVSTVWLPTSNKTFLCAACVNGAVYAQVGPTAPDDTIFF